MKQEKGEKTKSKNKHKNQNEMKQNLPPPNQPTNQIKTKINKQKNPKHTGKRKPIKQTEKNKNSNFLWCLHFCGWSKSDSVMC